MRKQTREPALPCQGHFAHQHGFEKRCHEPLRTGRDKIEIQTESFPDFPKASAATFPETPFAPTGAAPETNGADQPPVGKACNCIQETTGSARGNVHGVWPTATGEFLSAGDNALA
jgi:hypothetical protein